MTSHVETDLPDTVARLVASATDGTVPVEQAVRSDQSFADIGMTSLSFIRLIDSLEIKYGIEIDLERDLDSMRTVDLIVKYLERHDVGRR